MDKPNRPFRRRDLVLALLAAIAALALYWRTLAPTVGFLFDDTLEFQYVVPRLGILHQTGYPLYTLVAKLFTLLVPLHDPAFRLNLLSALAGALAVGMVYFVIRQLTTYRLAAFVGALTLAVGQTFWSQAVIAETYTIQMLIVAVLLYLALIWKSELERGNAVGARRRLYALALVMGLGLAHHRLIALLYPALALYVLFVQPNILRDWKTLARAAMLLVLPLLLYAYLPLRGAAGSANGNYQNTLQGFWDWVTAQEYMVFLNQDPFQVQRDAGYYASLFRNQFGIVGLVLATLGGVWLFGRPREWALLALALVLQALFVFNYHVENVYVHFLTTFLLLAVFMGAGADGLLNVAAEFAARNRQLTRFLLLPAAGLLLIFIPLNLIYGNYAPNDLSTKWDVYDYGLDVLNQPVERDATIVGIQGEVTLLRYLQENVGLRTDIRTIVADKEDARLAAVERAIAENRIVYLTRPLKGLAAKYSLASLGPLIRVQSGVTPSALQISHALESDFAPNIKLVGYDLDPAWLNAVPGRWHIENGRFVRVTLYWQPVERPQVDAMVSVKLVGKDKRVVGQLDRHPVLDAYSTLNWRAGEVIADSYTVPVFLGVPPGEYSVNVTLYEAQSGTVIGQRDISRIALTPDVAAPRLELGPDRAAPRRDVWNLAHTTDADFGPLSLAGYSLDADAPVRPGDALPLTLVWRSGAQAVANHIVMRVWLEDSEGGAVASRDAPLGNGFPVSAWLPGQYVRDWPVIRIPANVADGKYPVKLALARDNDLMGNQWLPFAAPVVKLGEVQVKNRPRVMTEPPIPNPADEIFGKKIKLAGYTLERDVPQRGVRLTLYWRSLALMDTSYAVFVHLLDGKETVITSADALPGGGVYPTTGWLEGEYITDIHAFTLPADLPEASYPIEIGLYDPASGARLKTDAGQDRVILVPVNIP